MIQSYILHGADGLCFTFAYDRLCNYATMTHHYIMMQSRLDYSSALESTGFHWIIIFARHFPHHRCDLAGMGFWWRMVCHSCTTWYGIRPSFTVDIHVIIVPLFGIIVQSKSSSCEYLLKDATLIYTSVTWSQPFLVAHRLVSSVMAIQG